MKKEIIFDFAKWGQEGISVNVNGQEVLTIHKNPHCPDYFYGMMGPTLMFNNVIQAFTMFEEVKTREFWVNVYNGGQMYHIRGTKEEADFAGINNRIALKRVTWTEGDEE